MKSKGNVCPQPAADISFTLDCICGDIPAYAMPGGWNMSKSAWKTYALWIAGTEAVGALSGFLTREGAALYSRSVNKPPLSPPAAVFPVVWGLLFVLMGVGGARVWLSPVSEARTRALRVYALQLAFNFFWSIIFFNLQKQSLDTIMAIASKLKIKPISKRIPLP